jgi:hypothetical protein
MSLDFISVNEQNRTYIFPNGKVTLTGVVGINVSKSGTHRLNLVDGTKFIVPSGWLAIKLDVKEWTF